MAKKAITGGQFHSDMKLPKPGAFLFYGEEGYLKRRELDFIRDKLCADESLAAFNHFIFTHENYSPDALMSAVMAPAMMSDLKLVELYCLPFAELRKKEDSDAISNALEIAASSEDTVMVVYTTPENFDPGEPKSPSAWMKLLSKSATPVEFPHEPTPRLVMWVSKHFSSEKIIAENPECTQLIETVGHDMTTLLSEIGKLVAYLHSQERDKLGPTDIDYVCPHNKEIGAFEFADALLDANNERAYYILADYKLNNEPVPVILGSITRIYTDLFALKLYADSGVTSDDAAKRLGLHPYVAKLRMAKARSCDRRALEAIVALCTEADAKLKSSSVNDYILLERLIAQVSQLRRRRVFD